MIRIVVAFLLLLVNCAAFAQAPYWQPMVPYGAGPMGQSGAPMVPNGGGPMVPALTLPSSPPPATTNFYLNASGTVPIGNDSNPGTLAQPWLTVHKLNNTTFPSGTVYVNIEGYPNDECLQMYSTGAFAAPSILKVQPYGTGGGITANASSPTCTNDTILGAPRTNGAINIDGKSNVTVTGLTLRGDGACKVYYGILVTDNVTGNPMTVNITNNDIQGFCVAYGAIGQLGTITGGSGYVSGTYTNVPLTGGSGTLATANITVSGGVVTAVTIENTGINFVSGDVLSASNANLGGSGSGFSVPVSYQMAYVIGSGAEINAFTCCNFYSATPVVTLNVNDNNLHGASVSAFDGCGFCSIGDGFNQRLFAQGNTVTNQGAVAAGGAAGAGFGFGLGGDNGGIVQFNLSHDIGYNNTNCGGASNFEQDNSSTSPIGTTWQFLEAYLGYQNGGCDGAGGDIADISSSGLGQLIYSHNNQGEGFLCFDSPVNGSPFGPCIIKYSISENDGTKVSVNGGAVDFVCSGCTNSDGYVYFYNNTIYTNPGSGTQRGTTVGFQSGGPPNALYTNNIFANGLDPAGGGLVQLVACLFSNNAPYANETFIKNYYYLYQGGTANFYQCGPTGNNYTFAQWQAEVTGGDFQSVASSTNPGLSAPGTAGTLVWTPSTMTAGAWPPSGLDVYELTSGPAVGTGVALNYPWFSTLSSGAPGARDAFGNAPAQAAPGLHCVGAYDPASSCGIESASPVATVTAPSAGTISGTSVSLTATCTESGGNPQGVLYLIGGVQIIGTNYVPPTTASSNFPTSFNSYNYLDGTYTITAQCWDFAGKSTVSSSVSVTISNGTGATCTQANLWDSVATGRNSQTISADNNLICGLVAAGQWNNIDAMYMPSTSNTATSLLNMQIAAGAGYGAYNYKNLTPQGTCTFTAYKGYICDGTTGYFDTNYPSNNGFSACSQYNCTMLTYVINTVTPTVGGSCTIGNELTTGSYYSFIDVGATGGNPFAVNDNNGGLAATSYTTTVGSWGAVRTSSTSESLWLNGSQVFSGASTSPAFVGGAMSFLIDACRFGASFAASNFSTTQIAGVVIGAFDMSTVMALVNTRMQNLLVPINVY